MADAAMPVQHTIFELIDPAGMPVMVGRFIVGYDDIGRWPIGTTSTTVLMDPEGHTTGWRFRVARVG